MKHMCAALMVLSAAAWSQGVKPIDIVEIKTGSTVQCMSEGTEITLSVHLTIKKRWHINAHETTDSYLTPTVVHLDSSNNYSVKTIAYPPADNIKLQFSENELALYEGETVIIVTAAAGKPKAKEAIAIKGFVQYQPCNDQTCLFPVKKPFTAIVKF